MKKLFAVALCLLVAACATPYKPIGLMGGVDATQLGPDMFRISARGNGYTDPTRIQDFVLLKSSELAMQNGYSHFMLLSSQDASRSGSIVTPGYYSGTTTAQASAFGNTAFGTARTTGFYTPPTVTNFIKPGADVYVKLLKNPPAEASAFDANFIYASLSPKYITKK